MDLYGSWWGPVAGSCERGNVPVGSVIDGEFFDQQRHCQLFKKDSDAWNKFWDIQCFEIC
jgi:hypothetical protein